MAVTHLMAKKFVEVSHTGLVRKPLVGVPVKLARKLPTGTPHTRELAKLTGGYETLVSCTPLAKKPPADHHTIEARSTRTEKGSPFFMQCSSSTF